MLINETKVSAGDPEGNPWGVSFMTMFHMSNDSHLFRTREELEDEGWVLAGNVFDRGEEKMLPLYEAKMMHQFDHRWATYEGTSVRDVTLTEKQNPYFCALPRYWVASSNVDESLSGRWDREWLAGWRDIARSTDERTTIAGVDGKCASPEGGTLLVLSPHRGELVAGLVAAMDSFAQDLVARQKVGGTHLKFFTMRQLPLPSPEELDRACTWSPSSSTAGWVSARVLELTHTAWDMAPFAEDLGDVDSTGRVNPPFIWYDERRFLLRAELDAAFLHMYGLERDEVDYIMDTFPIVRRKDEAAHGEYRTKRVILEMYDAMAEAMRAGTAYESPISPPPGEGPRHPQRSM